jgi:endonuclease III
LIAMPTRDATRLHDLIGRLEKQHGMPAAPPADTAFALVLWEKVAYLAPEDRRAMAFAMLREQVGLTPEAILGADPKVLREIARAGGKVGFEERAGRMQDAAALVIDEFGGSLDSVLALPLPNAMRALQKIYGIGEPGAERILLLMRAHRVLPLDSNGARTMVRLGYGADHKNYTTMYRSVRESAAREVRDEFDWLIGAHLLLRKHGQEVCKTSAPRCEMCALQADCPFGRASLRRTPKR